MAEDKTIRVLHRIGILARGGIETWLMNLLRMKPPNVHFDFAVNLKGDDYEDEARERGCHIYYSEPISRFKKRLIGLQKDAEFLKKILTANRYDVFHIHGEEFMGDALKAAAAASVPVRVAHCHGTALARGKRSLEMTIRLVRFRTLDRSRILKYATDICAVSNEAGRLLMGSKWKKDPRCRLLYCGVPLNQFREVAKIPNDGSYRVSCGIPRDAIVVGHVGSMGLAPAKNQFFLLEVFDILSRRDKRYHLYLAGDGLLRPSIEQWVRRRGLKERVLMPGICKDVPALMVYGFDVFLLPSLVEGLPIVGLEAVAAGLYVVCSDRITKEFTDTFKDRITAVSLKESPSYWADQVEAAVKKKISPAEGVTIIENSPFSIRASLNEVIELYRKRLAKLSLC